MFQFSDDIDDDVLEDVLGISTSEIVNEGKSVNTNNANRCSTIVVETNSPKNNSCIALEDFDEDDLILSAFEDANNSFPENKNSTGDSSVLKSNTVHQAKIHTSQVACSSKHSDYAYSPVVGKHKSPNSDESPNTSKYSKIEYERKFPGPAGLILKKSKEISAVPGEKLVPSKSRQIEAHQIGDSLFDSNPSWQALLNDANSNSNKLLHRVNEFTINNVKRLNLVKDTSWKIPVFAAVIYNIDSSVCDPSVTLKDPSGEIRGTLHKDLWDQYNHLLLAGSTLLLRQVSVMSMINSRKLYLNITTNNIVSIYTPPTDDKSLTIAHITTLTESDFSNEIKTDKNTGLFNSPTSSIYSAKNSHARSRSNADLLNLIKNSSILDSSGASNSPKIPSSKNYVADFNSNSVTPVSSSVVDMAVKSSPILKSCENRASFILNELEGLDADSLFDDF